MIEQYDEEPENRINDISHEELDELLAGEQSPIKRSLAGVYDQHLSRGDFIREVLPQEVKLKDAIDHTMIRLLGKYDPDRAEAIIAHVWTEYNESVDTEEKAA